MKHNEHWTNPFQQVNGNGKGDAKPSLFLCWNYFPFTFFKAVRDLKTPAPAYVFPLTNSILLCFICTLFMYGDEKVEWMIPFLLSTRLSLLP